MLIWVDEVSGVQDFTFHVEKLLEPTDFEKSMSTELFLFL